MDQVKKLKVEELEARIAPKAGGIPAEPSQSQGPVHANDNSAHGSSIY